MRVTDTTHEAMMGQRTMLGADGQLPARSHTAGTMLGHLTWSGCCYLAVNRMRPVMHFPDYGQPY